MPRAFLLIHCSVFTEGHLGSADIEALSTDHPFINADWLQPAETLVDRFIIFRILVVQ